jgi:hypothetical protein
MKIEYNTGGDVITISAVHRFKPYKQSFLSYNLKDALRSFADSYNEHFGTAKYNRFTTVN